MANQFQRSIIQDMGTMLDHNTNKEDGDGDPGDGRPKIDAKPPSYRSVLDFFDDAASPHAEDDGPISVADNSPFERQDVEGCRVPVQAPAAASQASLLPTADDYANLFFCEPSEEEESRARLLSAAQPSVKRKQRRVTETSVTVTSTKHNKRKPTADDYTNLLAGLLAAAEPSGDGAAPCRTTAAAAARSGTATSTKHNKTMQRRVSFGAPSTLHLLAGTPPCSAMTPDERSVIWLSQSDLEAIKSSAQRSIQEVRDRVKGGCNGGGAVVGRRSEFRALMVAMEDETGSSIRGLEHRVFRRKWTRRDLIRDVLECQSQAAGLARSGRAMDGEERARLLARASRDRSFQARSVACADARDDRREVYGDAAGGDGVHTNRTLKRRKRSSGGTRKVRRGGDDNDVPPAFIHFAHTKM